MIILPLPSSSLRSIPILTGCFSSPVDAVAAVTAGRKYVHKTKEKKKEEKAIRGNSCVIDISVCVRMCTCVLAQGTNT
jgi:hypothetical protein